MSNFPNRPATALPGSIFIDGIMKLGANTERDDLIVQEILRGNFPEFLRHLIPITISNNGNSIIYKVMPDYLSVGNDSDYVRVPISGPSAQRIADAFGMLLPTPKISDQIYEHAKIKLAPKPLSGMSNINLQGKNYSNQQFMQSKMSDTDAFEYHNKIIQEQLGNQAPGELVAGHKKDIVLSNDLESGRLAIHGLHQKDGTPLQPGGASKHDASYKDYSHGTRLIDNDAILNGRNVKLSNVLKNSKYAYLLNSDGVLKQVTYNYTNKPESVAKNDNNTSSVPFAQRLNDYLNKINIG